MGCSTKKTAELGMLIAALRVWEKTMTGAGTCTEHHKYTYFIQRMFSLSCTNTAARAQEGCSPEGTRRDGSKVCLYLYQRGKKSKFWGREEIFHKYMKMKGERKAIKEYTREQTK